MFLGQTFLGDLQETVHLLQENQVHPNVQEIHIEIVGQNSVNETLSTQVCDISSLYEYYSSALKDDTQQIELFKCFLCELKFLCFKALYNHACTEHTNSNCHPIKCFMCLQLFAFTEECHNHLISAHQIRNPDAICYVCLASLPNCEALMNHMSSHHADYSCEICCSKFYTQEQLAFHQQYYNCSKKLMCDICGITFQSKLLLGLHALRHKQAECPLALTDLCSSFSTDFELISHFKETHKHKYKSLLKIIKCHDTEELFLADLLQTIARDKTWINPTDNSLDIQNWPSKITVKQDVECLTCTAKLTSVFQLWLHFLKNHLSSKKCPICDKRFKDTTSILIHLGSESCQANQDLLTTFACSQCEVVFDRKEELLDHQIIHVKPFQCSECDSSFQKQPELKRHLLDHGVPPNIPAPIFTCPECSSGWPCLANLRRHMRVHGNQRHFQCELCNASFKRQQALKVHSANAHGTECFTCPHCSNTCRSKQALFLHVCRVHVRLRRFICGLCAKPWPQNQDLRRHLSKTHKLDYPPLTKSMTVSSKEVHVIPSLEKLDPNDPLRITIAEVISQENEKLTRLYSEFGAGSSSIEAVPAVEIEENPVEKQPNIPANEEANKIYLSCDSCDFRCEDFNTWIEHTIGHEQISLNRLTSYPTLEILNIPLVPVDPVFITPVIPTPAINYGTLVTVLPTPNLATLNDPFTINPTLIEQPGVVSQALQTLVPPTEQEVLPGEGVETSSRDPGELININGLFVRIERYHGDASELMSKSTITFENACEKTADDGCSSELLSRSAVCFGSSAASDIAGNDESELVGSPTISFETACDKTDAVRTEPEREDVSDLTCNTITGYGKSLLERPGGAIAEKNQLAEAGDNNESSPSDDSNLTDEINVNINDTVRLANARGGIEIHPNNLLPCTQNSIFLSSSEKASTWSCEQCGKILSSSKSLERHWILHSGNRQFTCVVCDKAFTTKHNLKIHMLSHTQERPYSCQTCGANLRYLKQYVEHKKKHQGVKSNSCSICGRSFLRQQDLLRHQSTHTAEKRHQCSICSKSFPRLDSLKTHIPNMHGKFECDRCPRRFTSQTQLDQHQRSHNKSQTRKERVTCPVCGKTFARNAGLKVHLDLHASTKAHIVCYACPRKFRSMDKMLTHLRNFHKKWRDEHAEESRGGIVENCRVSVQTDDPDGGVYTQNIEGVFKVNARKDIIISPE